jgi:hypothetical protein
MQVITHHRPSINVTSEDIAKFQYSRFNPGLAMLETLFHLAILTAKPRTAHAAIDAVVSTGMSGIDELTAGLVMGTSLP